MLNLIKMMLCRQMLEAKETDTVEDLICLEYLAWICDAPWLYTLKLLWCKDDFNSSCSES